MRGSDDKAVWGRQGAEIRFFGVRVRDGTVRER